MRRQLRALHTQAALSGNIRVIQGTGHIHAQRQLRALHTQAALSGNIRVIQGTGHIHAQTHEEDVVRRQLRAALPEISGVTIDVRKALALADNERRRST